MHQPEVPTVRPSDVEGPPVEVLASGETHKADLLVYRVDGANVLVKDFRRKPPFLRETLGRLKSWREARALEALDGLEGIPRFYGRPSPYAVAMSYIPGRRCKKHDPQLQGNEDFMRRLEAIVRRMHERGVVHLDLKHRSNVIANAQDRPVVIDFESAVSLSTRWFGGRWAVELLGRIDWLAVQNWKRRLCPQMLRGPEVEQAELARRLRGRWLPRPLMRALRRVFTRPD